MNKADLQAKLTAAESDLATAQADAIKYQYANEGLKGDIIGLCKKMLVNNPPEEVRKDLEAMIAKNLQ